ncbi:MAG: hypothetical protein RMK18_06320 [Armatimonadota bacterium]|nr:hypothetical protein [Armatimonadota bacterium]MCX7777702.1 hypothetical protein [Armatimonadota bacterium]MDW8025461.1 hypothetical protein [Armatimonadota bacterium]
MAKLFCRSALRSKGCWSIAIHAVGSTFDGDENNRPICLAALGQVFIRV